MYHVLHVLKLCGLLTEPLNEVQRHHIVHIEKRFLILQVIRSSAQYPYGLPHRSVSLAPIQHAGRLQNRYFDLQCPVFWPSDIPSLINLSIFC